MPTVARDTATLMPFTYSPNGDDGPSFQLRALSTKETFDVNARARFDAENQMMRWNSASVESCLQLCLLGWDNFKDAAGTPVLFSKDAAENIERLGYALSMELFGKIMASSKLGAEQVKN